MGTSDDMAPSPSKSGPAKPSESADTASRTPFGPLRLRLARLCECGILVALSLFAVTVPHSIKAAERSWKLALLLWLMKLAVERSRPLRQPLSAPLLAFVSLSAVSSALSPEPYLSWDRMKLVCLVLVGIVVAQNVRRLSRAHWLALLLVLSGLAAAVFTGWQYTYGVGVALVTVPADSRLAQVGFHSGDVITKVAGHATHTPDELVRQLTALPPNAQAPVDYLPGLTPNRAQLRATPDDFRESGLGTSALALSLGKPFRAQGTLGHYVVFAEVLMQIGCMAWALLMVTRRTSRARAVLFAIALAGITAALFMTETRAALAGLALGCLIALLLLSPGKRRWLAIGTLVLLVAAATVWIQHSRGLHWFDRGDIGTQFRVLMWQDGARLVHQHPWFGVGMETVRVHYREWNIRGFLQFHVVSHFHSTMLQIAVERGVPALLAWVWFTVAYIVFLARLTLRLRVRNRLAAGIVAGVLAGFCAFTLTSFVHYNLGEEPVAMLLFFYYGLAAAIDRMASADGNNGLAT